MRLTDVDGGRVEQKGREKCGWKERRERVKKNERARSLGTGLDGEMQTVSLCVRETEWVDAFEGGGQQWA